MKKWFALMLAAMMILTSAFALADGVTLKTVSSFAGTDAAAGAYVEILKAYEEATGNKIEDASATSDEAWKASVLNDFAAGNEPDVLFFFAASADSAPILDKVVPISEINAAYPELNLTENAVLTEADGKVYAIPSRPFWEGLFVNTDLFEQYGLELPTDWAKLEAAIAKFNEVGIVPIAVSLSDIPHYISEFAIIASGTPQEHMARPKTIEEVPDSWYEGMDLIANAQVDIIDICLPTYLHAAHALAAMDKVKYLFVEKPVTLTMEEGDALLAKSAETGCQVQVGQVIRFWDEYVALRDIWDAAAARFASRRNVLLFRMNTRTN